ncbi:hypothetical protein EV199_4630 [Pseudobacter ginsenosidimutans]|uniref:Uncharacterized protein n=1 Tax=Pseudobacter ginsenosidimutans TaxID=661488 RepID=A0A4Q7MVK3_9BACT|nr:hypothetical protein EV199_4630 [Pseudobacter ginsenosidimutans]
MNSYAKSGVDRPFQPFNAAFTYPETGVSGHTNANE